MNIIVTCGPSYEPIDQVRRLTNFSTGRLGITLANHLTRAGHTVFCLKGVQATDPTPVQAHKLITFTTNDDLAEKLQALRRENIGVLFHAAALCDFKVQETATVAKIPTRGVEKLTLTLIPTIKILPRLRDWFPAARIVGWKYELNGGREDALKAAERQIQESRASSCILNGAAYGPGFALCLGNHNNEHVNSLEDLCRRLEQLAREP